MLGITGMFSPPSAPNTWPVIHAASGYDMAHLSYQPGRTRPDYCGIYHADVVTVLHRFNAARTPPGHPKCHDKKYVFTTTGRQAVISVIRRGRMSSLHDLSA